MKKIKLALTPIILVVTSATVLGCAWSMLTEHSVRFNASRSGRAFYRLPPLPIMYEPKTGKEITVGSLYDYGPFEGDYGETEPAETAATESEESKTWDDARAAVQENEMSRARHDLERFLELTKFPRLEGAEYERRNSARDMLDAIGALNNGSKNGSVKAYLNARYSAYHSDEQNLQELLDNAPPDKNLKDNWDYLRAALLVRENKADQALQAFIAHSQKYPSSEKHEAVMYMIAKLTMESSHSFGNTACGILPESDAEPIENCRDSNWQKAIGDFQKLMRQHPNGRYFNDARGWLAYLYRRGGNRAQALAEYYRMLGDPNDWSARLEAKKSLQIIGHEYDDATLDEVESLIADDKNAAMAYAYHRIYNHAIDLTYEEINTWITENESAEEARDEEKRVRDAQNSGSHELERVARFATKMVDRHPNAGMSGSFLLRVAEAQFELQNFSDAQKLAKRSLASGISGDLRAEALWIKGSTEHAAKDFKSARVTFHQLIMEYPKSKLIEGARRLLAMTAEDQDDLEGALEQYLALGYDYDVAYFVDVLMPIDRLAKFVDSHRDIPGYNKLLYSVGVRYMRDKRWIEAREALRRVVTVTDLPATTWNYEDTVAKNVFSKSPDYYSKQEDTIKTDWVMQDLKTIDVMENFDRAIMTSPTDETQAEAMYQLASFQFDADELLFYNPAIWKGGRERLFSDLLYLHTMRQPGESQRLFEYSQTHETLARSIVIYVDLVNRYPNARAAKDALYSAAVAHEKLSNLNSYWRDVYGRGMFAGPRNVGYSDVKSAYPNYQLPRGTLGWQAATRTVNGGPGWAPKPTPVPRETREHKAKRLLREMGDYVSTKITGVLPKIESKVNASFDWFSSVIEAAVYGVLSAIGIWALVLIGVAFHSERVRAQLLPPVKEHANCDSRVDKFLE